MTDAEYDRVREIARGEVAGMPIPAGRDTLDLHDRLFPVVLDEIDADPELSHLEAAEVSAVAYEVAAEATR